MEIALTIYEIVSEVAFRIKEGVPIRLASVILLIFALHGVLPAQDQSGPQAFRKNALMYIPLVLPSTLDMQMLESFILMQKANSGEAPAEHELGLRYLLGRGFPADTEKAAYWIRKAADQGLPVAQYNFGILAMQGWGIRWNPFIAFRYYLKAAENDFPQADYVVGLIYTDNLLVERNWAAAYRWIKKAANLGMDEAKKVLQEMDARGLGHDADSTAASAEFAKHTKGRTAKRDTSFSLLFIDFHADTALAIPDSTLYREAYREIHSSDDESDPAADPATAIDSSAHSVFLEAARSCNPEALCLLGRCYEEGIGVPKDAVLAGEYYLRALHLDSYRAPVLLWKLMLSEQFERALEARTNKRDPDAMYVWSGLTSIGYSNLLSSKQAFELLQRAAREGHVPSIVELGLCYFTGRWTEQNRGRAVELWNAAASAGSVEAAVRLAAANVFGQIHTEEFSDALKYLRETSKKGSLISTVALGYCYENGLGMQKDTGEAYRIYYRSMRRGSETAFLALKRMYDELRPADKTFQVSD